MGLAWEFSGLGERLYLAYSCESLPIKDSTIDVLLSSLIVSRQQAWLLNTQVVKLDSLNPSCLFLSLVLEVEIRTLPVLGKAITTKLHSQAFPWVSVSSFPPPLALQDRISLCRHTGHKADLRFT